MKILPNTSAASIATSIIGIVGLATRTVSAAAAHGARDALAEPIRHPVDDRDASGLGARDALAAPEAMAAALFAREGVRKNDFGKAGNGLGYKRANILPHPMGETTPTFETLTDAVTVTESLLTDTTTHGQGHKPTDVPPHPTGKPTEIPPHPTGKPTSTVTSSKITPPPR